MGRRRGREVRPAGGSAAQRGGREFAPGVTQEDLESLVGAGGVERLGVDARLDADAVYGGTNEFRKTPQAALPIGIAGRFVEVEPAQLESDVPLVQVDEPQAQPLVTQRSLEAVTSRRPSSIAVRRSSPRSPSSLVATAMASS